MNDTTTIDRAAAITGDGSGEPLPPIDPSLLGGDTLAEGGIPYVGEVDIDAIYRNPKYAHLVKTPEQLDVHLKRSGVLVFEQGGQEYHLTPQETLVLLDYLDHVNAHDIVQNALQREGGAS